MPKPKTYTAFGETKTLYAWSNDNRCEVSQATLYQRVKHDGWHLVKAMTTPTQNGGHGGKRVGREMEAWGEVFCSIRALADDPRCQVGKDTLYYRLTNGWEVQEAVDTMPGGTPRAKVEEVPDPPTPEKAEVVTDEGPAAAVAQEISEEMADELLSGLEANETEEPACVETTKTSPLNGSSRTGHTDDSEPERLAVSERLRSKMARSLLKDYSQGIGDVVAETRIVGAIWSVGGAAVHLFIEKFPLTGNDSASVYRALAINFSSSQTGLGRSMSWQDAIDDALDDAGAREEVRKAAESELRRLVSQAQRLAQLAGVEGIQL